MAEADKKKPQELLEDLRLALSESKGHLVALPMSFADLGKKKKNCWRRLKLTEELAGEFGERVSGFLVTKIANGAVQAFTYDNMLEGHIGVWPATEDALLQPWIAELPVKDWPYEFDGDEIYRKKLKFLATRIQLPDGADDVVVYMRHTQSSFAQKKGKLAALLDNANEFKTFDSSHVIELNHHCDFLVWQETVFIFNQLAFESLTKIRAATKMKATSGFEQIEKTENLNIEHLKKISAKIMSNAVFARKVAGAEVLGVFRELDIKAIAETIEKLNLSVGVEWVKGELRLSIDLEERDQVKVLLNLLTDSYTEGRVTHFDYLSHAKELVN